MRYSLPRSEIMDYMIKESEVFFNGNNIDVSKIPSATYAELFAALALDSLEYIIQWNELSINEMETTLIWVYVNKRKPKRFSHYYELLKNDEHMALALSRYRIQLAKYITYAFQTEDQKEEYLDRLMDNYFYHVLDEVQLQIKNMLRFIINGRTWNVFDIVQTKRTLELVDYGDFRVLSWEMLRNK